MVIIKFLRNSKLNFSVLLNNKFKKEVNIINNSQFYLDFVYDDYLNNHSEFKYFIDLISLCDWSNIPLFKNTSVGATGYSPRAMCKASFIKVVKNLSSVNELIFFFRINPRLSQFIGFELIKNRVPDETTFPKV